MAKKGLMDRLMNVIAVPLATACLSMTLDYAGNSFSRDYVSHSYNQNHSVYSAVSEETIDSVSWPESSKEDLSNVYFSTLNYKEAIKTIDTPFQVQEFFNDYFSYDYVSAADLLHLTTPSFKDIYSKKKGVCLDYAVCAAALLSDNGYPPLILVLGGGGENKGHAVFLFKDVGPRGLPDCFWGMGDEGDFSFRLGYSLDELVKDYNTIHKKSWDKYAVINLNDAFKFGEWMSDNVNLQNIGNVDKWTKVK
jgi:hypothetical protein